MTKTTTSIILQGCPFCGGKARMTSLRRGRFTRIGTNHQVLCNTCKARGPLVPDDIDQAAVLWNRAAGWTGIPLPKLYHSNIDIGSVSSYSGASPTHG